MTSSAIDLYFNKLRDNFEHLKTVTKDRDNIDKSALLSALNKINPTDETCKIAAQTIQALFNIDRKHFLNYYGYIKNTKFLCQLLGGFSMEKTLRIENTLSIHQGLDGKFRLGPPRHLTKHHNDHRNSGKKIMNITKYKEMIKKM